MWLLLQHTVGTMLVLGGAAALAQSPAFDAASVKPAANPRGRVSLRGGPGNGDPAQITYTNATLSALLQRAWDLKPYQVAGPDWIGSERYDVAARIPPGATIEQFRQMLQTLLTDRFHLALRRESRNLNGYELVAGRNGPKLEPARGSDAAEPSVDLSEPPKTDLNGFPILEHPGLVMMEGVRGKAVVVFLTARSQPISALVERLSREFRLPVLDKTGLAGKYDFTLEFAPQPPGALPPPPSADTIPTASEDAGPDLITAVAQQLGLKLIAAKLPTTMLIVDRADRVPAVN